MVAQEVCGAVDGGRGGKLSEGWGKGMSAEYRDGSEEVEAFLGIL